MAQDTRYVGPSGPSSSRFTLPHIPPSSPPASPPRRRQHSNSISESLADGAARFQSTIEKSQLLESEVLRAYPPAVNSSKRKVTPPQPRLVVPPSPPESFIAYGTRQYRSGSSATQATVRTMPATTEEEEHPMPPLTGLKGKLNKALAFGRGHRRQPSDIDRSPASALTAATQSPQSVPNSALTQYTDITTAHTSVYSPSFPVLDDPIEEKSRDGSSSDSSYGLPAYHKESQVSHVSNRDTTGRMSDLQPRSSVGSNENSQVNRQIVVTGGEVRVEIKRPLGEAGHQNVQNAPLSSVQVESRVSEGKESPGSGGVKEEEATKVTPSGKDVIGLGIRPQRAYPNLRDASNRPPPESLPARNLSYTSVNTEGNSSKDSEEYLEDTVAFFEGLGLNESHGFWGPKGKRSLPHNSAPGDFPPVEPAIQSSSLLGEEERAFLRLSPAEDSSAVLSSGSSKSLNVRSNSPLALNTQVRPTAQRSRTQSRSSSATGLRPAFSRSLTGQTNILTNNSSSSVRLEEAEEMVRNMSADLGKRLSAMSSSAGSFASGKEAGFGAGIAVVVTADAESGINEMRGGLLSISDEADEDVPSSSRYGGSSAADKGKGKEVAHEDKSNNGDSNGDSNTTSKNDDDEGCTGTSSKSSEEKGRPVPISGSEEQFLVHPGDERYSFVYRVRSSSPDNQPLLVPFYKTSQPATFPYRNALISSLPQMSASRSQKSAKMFVKPHPSMEIPGLKTTKGDISPSQHLPFISPRARKAPSPDSESEEDDGIASLKSKRRFRTAGGGANGSSEAEADTAELMANSRIVPEGTGFRARMSRSASRVLSSTLAKGPARIYTSQSALDSTAGSPSKASTGLRMSQSASRVQSGSPSRISSVLVRESKHIFDGNASDEPAPQPSESTYATGVVDEGSTSLSAALQPSSPDSIRDNSRFHSANSPIQSPARAVTELSRGRKRSSNPPTVRFQNDAATGVLQEYRASLEQQNEISVVPPHRIEPMDAVRVTPVPTANHQMDERRAQILASHKSQVSNRFKLWNPLSMEIPSVPWEVLCEEGCEFRSKMTVFAEPPTLARPARWYGNQSTMTQASNISRQHVQTYIKYNAEELKRQKTLSIVLCSLCFLFPPLLILFASGHMNGVMVWWSRGKIDEVRKVDRWVAGICGTISMVAVWGLAAWGIVYLTKNL